MRKRLAVLMASVVLLPMLPSMAGVLPPEIEAGFRESRVFEGDGSIIVKGVNETVFIDYVTAHWREIMDHPECLPRRNTDAGMRPAVWPLSQACEFLPPAEYIQFLGRWLDWAESGFLAPAEAEDGFNGWSRKHHFLEANSDDSRVRAVLKRMIAVTPESNADEKQYLKFVLDGDLADNWEFGGGNEPDPRTPPETMPGSLPVFVYKHALKKIFGWILGIAGALFLLWKLADVWPVLKRRRRLAVASKIKQ